MNLTMKLPQDDVEYNKLKEGELSVDALQRRRDEEVANINYK
jgi:hypothetical protein